MLLDLHFWTGGRLDYHDLRQKARGDDRRGDASSLYYPQIKGLDVGNRRPPLRVTVLMSVKPNPLQGRKILIVEDEAAIALSLAAAVVHAGGIAIGPVATVAGAFALMADHKL